MYLEPQSVNNATMRGLAPGKCGAVVHHSYACSTMWQPYNALGG